jgi:putative tryptophan/tyrosine transport system substrate-binding protein
MKRRSFLASVAAISLVGSAWAQQRMRRVALVTIADVKRQPLASLVEGLRQLGYEQGRNLELLPSTAEGAYSKLADAAKAAVERQPDVIVTDGSTATRAAKAATRTIPIVMVVGVDPIEHGFVKQLARPEGNITGIAHAGQVLSAKRVELLKEVIPGIQRVGVIWSGESASQAASLKLIEAAAARLGIAVFPAEVRHSSALKAAFASLAKARVEALIPAPNAMFDREAKEIVRLADVYKIPVVYSGLDWARSGALFTYASDRLTDYRRAAVIVDKILKGAKPAEMAIEQPTKFELIINLKTAKALGIDIPKSVLFRADQVIQ